MRTNKLAPTSALVTGAAGQDGSYLIELLLAAGHVVHAQSRQIQPASAPRENLIWHVGAMTDQGFLTELLTSVSPDEIYNLAAMSRPVQSWDIPDETTLLNAVVPQRLCEFVAKHHPTCRLLQASSSDMFSGTQDVVQNENTCLRPQTPYGISKASAHLTIGAYRERYGLHASSAILFNHESPRRPLSFVSQKIAYAAAAISLGQTESRALDERGRPIVTGGKVQLGNLDIRRDFGFAGDVARAMYMIASSNKPGDYIVGTGQNKSIAEFCEAAFDVVGLNWRDHTLVDTSLIRAADMPASTAEASKLRSQLGWNPKVSFSDLVKMMVEEQISVLRTA
ncbi:GDP-mannose 4,6-dehydratase [Tardiphaga sp. vice278]|uniref:GDP-mannose 4,6-dehydratase n=1 Tax=Tardiphaga sp. vice278 TaxID=2592815 RepID=UPI0011631C11|nr:GDP-mannose 4,6-dehydratase [Tardiphaga sp. vice278]QDM17938.1 GDP-mannose 4,6-dehydratase [Tardiphaga sp. vice278]